MIPLHLRSTTVVVSDEHAEMLVSRGLAEWIPGGQGLVAKTRDDAPVLEAIAA
jgi:hypothetical protein